MGDARRPMLDMPDKHEEVDVETFFPAASAEQRLNNILNKGKET